MAKMTPMMQQYLDIKADNPDSILFFRLGDFYEMFMEDAIVASKILDITLTSRNKGATEEVPLCGIPYHSSQPYIAKLVQHGYKVAICEQVEDPKSTKGIVKREVVRVVTPGLVVDTDTLDPKRNNYLMAISPWSEESCGLAYVDITTGEFRVTEIKGFNAIAGEVISRDPAEVLLPEGQDGEALFEPLKESLHNRILNWLPEWTTSSDRAHQLIKEYYPDGSLEGFGCAHMEAAVCAAGMILHYLQETRQGTVSHLQS